MQRLADYLANQPAGSEVLFVGFTDDVGALTATAHYPKVARSRLWLKFKPLLVIVWPI